MNSTEIPFRKRFNSILNMQKLLWSVLTGSVFLLVLLAYVLNSDGVNIDPNKNTDLSFVLFPAAIILASISFFIRRYVSSGNFINKVLAKVGKDLENQSSESEREVMILKLAEMNFLPLVILLALNEAITNLGFVAALTSNSADQILPYAMVSTMLNLMIIPNAGRTEKQIDRLRVF